MKLEFWFDFASTYSYPSVMRIEALLDKQAVEVLWRPFLLGAIFNKQGWNDSPFNIYPVKGLYMWRDITRICKDLAIPFNQPSIFPGNGLLAARIATRFSDNSWNASFIKAVYSANFEHNKDISSPDVIADCLESLGQNAERVIKEANLQKSKDDLRIQTEKAHKKGIFGAPSFYVGNELFWGNDRLENAIKWVVNKNN